MLSERVQSLGISATIAMSSKAREMREAGLDVIDLSVGEPDFNTPDFIKEAAKKAIDQNYSKYSPVSGYGDLKQAIVDKLKRENGLNYTTDEVVVSTGAKHSIYNALMCLLNPGDEVIIPAPFWVSYFEMIKMIGGIPVIAESSIENNYKATPEVIESKVTHKTKLILFSSPNNPSGATYTKTEIEQIATLVKKHNLYVISDEIYEYISYGQFPTSVASFDGMKDRAVVINGMSKGFAMTGWRLGYMVGPKWLAKGAEKFQGQVTSGTSSISQRAAIVGLNGGKNEIEYMRVAFQKRRDYLMSELENIEGFRPNLPEGAFYLFPDISGWIGKTVKGKNITSAADLSMLILEETKVVTVPGGAFGIDTSIRMSYATSMQNLEKAIERFKELVV